MKQIIRTEKIKIVKTGKIATLTIQKEELGSMVYFTSRIDGDKIYECEANEVKCYNVTGKLVDFIKTA